MTRRGLILFAVMSLAWGIAYLLIRISVAEISPANLVFVRSLIGAAILLPIAVLRVDMRPVLRHWRWVLAFSVVEIAIPWVLLGMAEQHVSSSLAGLLIAGVPLAGAVIAVLSGGADRVGRTGLVGLLIGLAGVAAIVGSDVRASGLVPLLQIGVVVVGYALGPAILARRLAGQPSIAVMGLSLAFAALVYGPISAIGGWPAALPSQQVILAVVILGVISTALAFVAFGALIKEIGPIRATLITYVNPVVAAIVGVLVLHETFTLIMLLGFALVIVGSALATRPTSITVPAGASTGA